MRKLVPRAAALSLLLWAPAPGALAADAAAQATLDVSDSGVVRKWGVRVDGVRLSAAGHMLDFRYTVVDARKATPLFDRKTKPVLWDEASGRRLEVPVPPKTGPLRSSNEPRAGRSYFMFFANRGRAIRSGSQVTVEIGAFKVKGIRVEGEPSARVEER
jgi:hypothetical protein